MATNFNLLTDNDVVILKGFINDLKSKRQNPASRVTTEASWDAGEDHQAPETYIAKPPSTGIPAASGTTPGSAQCDIYRILGSNSGFEIVAIPGVNKTVYNISGSEITSDWVFISRDKPGKWIVDLGSSSQGKILFKISTADSANCKAVVSVLGRPCGMDTVAEESGGLVTVYDPLGCVFNEPDVDLDGRFGTAFRVKIQTGAGLTCAAVPEDTCIWAVDYLCCVVCVAAGTGT